MTQRTMFLFALILSNTLGLGCSTRAYVRHAQTAFALYGVNEAAVPVVETVCDERAVNAASDPSVPTATARVNAERVLENCRTAAQIQHRFAEGHRIWMTTAAMADGDPERMDIPRSTLLLHQLYDIYVELAELLREQFGVPLPAVPRLVLRLLDVPAEAP